MPLLGLFEPLSLKQKCLFGNFFKKYPVSTSELTFVNLWVWLMCHPVWFYLEDNCLYIIRKGNNGFFGFVPLGPKPIEEKVSRLFVLMRSFDLECRMERVVKEDAILLEKAGYKIKPDPDQFDYVYNRDDLATLEGRRYSRKRNHIKRCIEKNRCEYTPVTKKLLPACHGFLEEWCKIKQCFKHPDLCCEHRAIRFLLYDYDKFNITGGAVLVDKEVAAVTFAQALNQDTAVIHFEKAHPEIDGMYPLINQWFCQKALGSFKYINREQDLGIQGLKKAKESYYPAMYIEKYIVTQTGH